MGIEITTKPLAARLYDAIAAEAHALSFAERFELFNAMKNRRQFDSLPARLRAAFEGCAQRIERGVR